MAYRGGATVSAASFAGNTATVTVSGIGIQLGDIVLLAMADYIGDTRGFPSGFAVVPGTSSEPNDGNTGLFTYYKVATSTEVAATTLAVTGIQFGGALTCRVYSGRSTTSPFTTNSPTTHSSAAALPITFSITGLTAAAGDDVCVFVAEQLSGGSTATTLSYAPSSGYANAVNASDTTDTNAYWMVSSDLVNTSGATGTIAGVLSLVSGAGPGTTGYLAQVISIAVNFVPLPLAVRQACVADSGATSVLFQNGSFASATLAGSTILVVCKASSVLGNQFTSFADSINGSYQSLDAIADPTALGIFKAFVFQNAASIGTAQSLTINASQSEPHLGFVAFEIQGLPIPALAAHTVALQTIASTATNAISSGQVQAGIGPAIAVAVSINTTGNNGVSSDPNVGTGFTICPSPGGNFWSAFGGLQATAEFQTYTNPGGISATFTAQAASSDDYVTFIAVFNSIGGAFVPPFTLSQFFVNDQYIQM